jgi:glycosyltransferase involved in cell wall biosynthesis
VIQPHPYFQYVSAQPQQLADVLIISIIHETSTSLANTLRSLQQQSLQNWHWLLIVSAQEQTIESLVPPDDARITLIHASGSIGQTATEYIANTRQPYICWLDTQATLAPTFLEKALWLLATQPDVACCSTHIGTPDKNWGYGFEQGRRFLERNYVAGSLVCTRESYNASGGLTAQTPATYELWDVILRLAKAGYWGITIPEVLVYAPSLERLMLSDTAHAAVPATVHSYIQQHYHALANHFPIASPASLLPYEDINRALPLSATLRKPTGVRRILILMPWLIVGGAERVNMNLIEYLTQHGYQVSFATTLRNVQHNWVDAFAQYTPDIFLLDHFIQLRDFPRFLVYLIQSRQIDIVLISNSYLGYQLLPHLRDSCPQVAFVDYCHSGDKQWRNGGYPRCGAAYQPALDLNITSSEFVKDWMVELGASANRIEVAYTNVDTNYWKPDPVARQRLRGEYEIADNQCLIVFIGRLAGEKRPRMLVEILAELRKRTDQQFLCMVIGDGPERALVAEAIAAHGMETHIRMLGRIADEAIRDNLAAADIILQPSETEGISVALLEAMAMGVVPVSVRVGGQAELVTPDCGFLIPRSSEEREGYISAMHQLLSDSHQRQRMQAAARQRVETHFPLHAFGPRMAVLFDQAMDNRQKRVPMAHAMGIGAEHAVQAIELIRLEHALDEVWADRERLRNQVPPAILTTKNLAKQLVKRIAAKPYHWAIAHGMQWLVPLRYRIAAFVRNMR